jgi:hypothetical protein
MAKQKVLLLVGSPKESKSTSDVVGSYLLKKFEEKGYQTEKSYANQLINLECKNALLEIIDETDFIILSSPLYIDCLPSQMIHALQVIKEHRKVNKRKCQRLIAISNSGFPEGKQNNTALEICRRFAIESGFEWLGGLPLGGGAGIDGKPLDRFGIYSKRLLKSLDLSVEAFSNGEPIPDNAIRLMDRFTTTRGYSLIVRIGIRLIAKKNGALNRIHDQPFKKENKT